MLPSGRARARRLVLRPIPQRAKEILGRVGNVGRAADERRAIVGFVDAIRGLRHLAMRVAQGGLGGDGRRRVDEVWALARGLKSWSSRSS